MRERSIASDSQLSLAQRGVIGVGIAIGAYFLSNYNYLLFHSVVEVFSIVIAFAIFVVAWNTRSYHDNDYLVFIGIAYLFVGGIDFIHTLAYKGMGVFTNYGADLPTQLWILGRYTESLSLLLAPLFFTRKLKYKVTVAGYGLTSLFLLLTIFYWGIFPDCFVSGSGLTTFKVVSEYVISGLLLGAIFFLSIYRDRLERETFYLLISSLLLTVFAELSFTFYVSVYGLSNLVGHLFKLGSFYLIYLALIKTGLREPYRLMFRELKESKDRYQNYVEELGDALFITKVGGEDHGKIIEVNTSAEKQTGYSREELIGMNISENLAEESPPEISYEEIDEKLSRGEAVNFTEKKRRKGGTEYWTEVVVTPIKHEGKDATLSVNRDVTERIRAQKSLKVERERLKKLHHAVDRFQSCQTEEELYETTLEVTRDALGFDISLIYIARGQGLVPVASNKLETSELPSYEKDAALVGTTYTNGETIWGDDVREVEEAKPEVPQLRGYMSVPIGDLGVFQASSRTKGAFTEVDIELAEILAGHLNEEIKRIRLEEKLKEQAIRDPLTGLYNRRYFNETLTKEVERSQRYGHNIAFIMIDVNRFKEINDTYSHQTGDKVLKEVANLLRANVREADTVVRYGGDEFLVMLPETDGDSRYTGNRIRSKLEDWNNESNLLDFPLTLAMGISHWNPDQDRDVEEALKEADKKMYEQKGE
ncbi:diguanylate cyclase [Candidatus Bipolaricaulota bacterium]|nr:diguanylate cyclase [Candidatus Bipolaricaulota bacterium]